MVLTTAISIAFIFSSGNARKVEAARLKELARQEAIKALEQTKKAKKERLKAEQERQKALAAKEDAERARQLAIQAQKAAEQIKKKSDDLIENNLYTKASSRISPIFSAAPLISAIDNGIAINKSKSKLKQKQS